MLIRSKKLLFASAVSLFALTGCVADEHKEPAPQTSQPTCTGAKCDSFSDRFADLYSDMKSVELDDLTVLGAGLATDELNGQLADVPYSQIELSPTSLFGAQEDVFGETVVHDIGQLRAGLTERLGEDAFATKIVGIRQEALAANPDMVFAESHFEVGPSLGTNWGLSHGDAVGNVGFNADASIESVVIAPYEDRVDAIVDNPLSAIGSAREFVLPRHADDVRAMAPGESLAMRADGTLGLNLGVGVPFLLGTLTDFVSLHARASFGARVALGGKLDVQLVRGTNDDVWVDVGVANQHLRHFSVALETGFGVEGLPEVNVDLGPLNMSLDDIAEKALRKQLNERLTPSVSATSSSQTSRLTVARFRFDLARTSDEVEQALAQSLRGDIRLAQALANRGGEGVVQELDLTKEHRSESDYIGFRFLGMEFYRANGFDTGTVQISADGQNQTLLFTEIEDKSGLFFTNRNTSWRTLVSLQSRDGRLTDASVNARITLREDDKFFDRDQMLDHVDALAGYFVGFEPFYAGISAEHDALLDWVDNQCPRPGHQADYAERRAYRECIDALPTSPEYISQKDAVAAANEQVLAGALRSGFVEGNSADITRKLLAFKLGISARGDFMGNPEGRMLTQVRFSDDAVHHLMVPGRHQDFELAVEQVLRLMAAERDRTLADKTDDLDDYVDDRRERIAEMAALYADATVQFADYEALATMQIDGEAVGDESQMVLIPVDSQQDMRLASLAEHKAKVLERLVPELSDLAEDGIFNDLDEPTGFVVGYAMLWMAEPSQVELLTKFDFDDDEEALPDDVDIYAIGSSPLIGAGQFDLETLLAGP
ncbi:hypothetical protein FIV42_16215 [Persicimonas caeni]|uniref:DUF945 domain-containing protein n=1 Tax=Persicimonas caeni TaxID=2292766 RepID=A0A4Y6PV64_PERCE|nr:hypothetical protein [Persicimonas caeni]QDG52226.1 hypothetical protein FIV42_16215 [Persicimonas caeni]QED33448.1 hypothetical protein FRD00_16210 [Persicimonas caeni]